MPPKMGHFLFGTDFVINSKKEFDMTTMRLERTRDKVIGGVLGGIAKYFGWDVSIVRLVYVILTVASIGFPGILVYLILWVVMPEEY